MKITKTQLREIIREELYESYSDTKVKEIGKSYTQFRKLLRSINYDDFMEYAENSGDFKTLDILNFLKKRSKYI